MFSKIKFLDNLTEDLLKEINIDNKEEIKEGLFKYKLEDGELEDIIDTSNIHGWLDERVKRVEEKFAYFISEVLKRDESKLEFLKEEMKKFGKEDGINFSSTKEVYQFITSKFLDGMPCDGSLMLMQNEEDCVIFKIVRDVHREIWDNFYDYRIYWELRDSYINGLLENSGYKYENKDGNYIIR